MRVEDVKVGIRVNGLDPAGAVKIVQVEQGGGDSVTLLYRDSSGAIRDRVLMPGYYPTQYVVTYDAKKKLYSLLLAGLKPWQAEKLVAMDGR